MSTCEAEPLNQAELVRILMRVDRHLRWKYSRLVDLDDLMGAVTDAIADCVRHYNPAHPRANLTFWVFKHVKWAIAHFFRDRKPQFKRLDVTVGEASPEEVAEFLGHVQIEGRDAEVKALLWRQVNDLPAQTRTIFLNYHLGGYTARELAERFGCSTQWIYKLLARTEDMLAKRLSGQKKIQRIDGRYRHTT